MGLPGRSKVLTLLTLILALIGVFTYNIVDFELHNRLDQAGNNNRPDQTGNTNPPDQTGNNNPPDQAGDDPLPKGNDNPDDNPVIADVVSLRVMFIGASITRGEVSTGDRGYRKLIRDTLISWGKVVNCVGFNRFGDWDDNDVEGYSANRIRTTTKHAAQAIPVLQPNLILAQVGTSDCFQNDDTENIGPRMRLLVDTMFKADPQVTVILSTLVTTPNPKYEPCILSANTQIRQVADDLMRENKTVALAEMHYEQGLPDRPKPEDIGPDKIHPTDKGYMLMGNIFLEKIREVEGKGFLRPAVNNSIPDNGDDGREVEDRLKAQAEAEHPITTRSKRRTA